MLKINDVKNMELNKKIRILSWTLVFIILFNIASFLFFFMPNLLHHNSYMPGHPSRSNFMHRDKTMNLNKRILEELDLNNQQIIQYQQFRHQFFEQTRVFLDSIRYYDQKIDQIITSANPDEKEIENYIERIGSFHIRIKQNSIKYYFNVKEILDQEQQKKYQKIYLDFRKTREIPPFCKQ